MSSAMRELLTDLLDDLAHIETRVSALEERTHRNKTVVALANKLTRIAWAILTRPGENYLRSKGAAA